MLSFEEFADNKFFCQKFPDFLKFPKPTQLMVIDPSKNEFYQKPYRNYSIPYSKSIDEQTWRSIAPVTLSSTEFMIEMFVRQYTFPTICTDLVDLPNGEFVRIGSDSTTDSHLLKFNKKFGDQMSLAFNKVQNITKHFLFRKVFEIRISEIS